MQTLFNQIVNNWAKEERLTSFVSQKSLNLLIRELEKVLEAANALRDSVSLPQK